MTSASSSGFADTPAEPVDIGTCELGKPINGTAWVVQKSASSGQRYFYNTATKASTWSKPEELMTVRERLLAQCPWKEHVSDEGKKYYFNPTTGASLWAMPPEYRECLDRAAVAETLSRRDQKVFIQKEEERQRKNTAATATAVTSGGGGGGGDAGGSNNSNGNGNGNRRVSRDEAGRLFRELLSEKFKSSTTPWDRVVKEAGDDPRFGALRSASERKHVFSEWCSRQRTLEVAERRDGIRKIKEDFLAMLEEHYPDAWGDGGSSSSSSNDSDGEGAQKASWAAMRPLVAEDPRFRALSALVATSVTAHDITREQSELFDEFLARRRFRRVKALMERKNEEATLLRTKLREDKRIAVATPWRAVREAYLEDPLYPQLDAVDVLRAFEARTQELEAAARVDREQEDAAAVRHCRHVRDAFRAMLAEQEAAGTLDMDTQWRDFARREAQDPHLRAFADADKYWGSRPQDLFADAVERLRGVYEEDEKVIYKTLDRIEEESAGKRFFVFRLKSTLEDFTAFFRKNGHPEALTALKSQSSLAFFFNYNMKCLLEKKARLLRTLAKLEKAIFPKTPGSDADATAAPLSFDEAAKTVLAGHSSFESKTLDPEDKRAIYEEFVADPKKALKKIGKDNSNSEDKKRNRKRSDDTKERKDKGKGKDGGSDSESESESGSESESESEEGEAKEPRKKKECIEKQVQPQPSSLSKETNGKRSRDKCESKSKSRDRSRSRSRSKYSHRSHNEETTSRRSRHHHHHHHNH